MTIKKMNNNQENLQLSNPPIELLLVVSFYKEPKLYIEYSDKIKSKYDFSDELSKFYYECFNIMYKTFSQDINKNTINSFMSLNEERFDYYKKQGGYNTLQNAMDIAVISDFEKYFVMIKKYALLREYNNRGINVNKIIQNKNFEILTVRDIYNIVTNLVTDIKTIITTNDDVVLLNTGCSDMIDNCIKRPDIGLMIPYPLMHDMFRGIRLDNFMAFGMLSNEGKSRFLMTIITYICFALNENVVLLLNEMTAEQMRACLITTVINNEWFWELHGVKNFYKDEREISMGIFKDNKGKTIERKIDNDGNFIESEESYLNRIYSTKDYQNVKIVTEWVDKEVWSKIFIKDISLDYTDKNIEMEIKSALIRRDIRYFFYDTLKNPNEGDWSYFKNTATKIKALCNNLHIFVGVTIQLSNDTNSVEPLDLNSSNISNCKQIKEIMDELCLCKTLTFKDYQKYIYIPTEKLLSLRNHDFESDGEIDTMERLYSSILPQKEKLTKYMIFVTDKNRAGEKKNLLFKADLSKNIWTELGEVYRRSDKDLIETQYYG